MNLRGTRIAAALLTLAAPLACSGGPTAPNALTRSGAGGARTEAGDAGKSDSGVVDGARPDAALPIRTVEQRDPFGDTAIEDNFLIDGDFELSSAGGQYGWSAIQEQGPQAGQIYLPLETGGLCRSGMSCGVINNGVALIGYAAEPRDKPMDIAVWVKPPGSDCSVVQVSLISCSSTFAFTVATVSALSPSPGPDGWCHLEAIAPSMDSQPCLFVTASLPQDQQALIDDASIVAADGSGSRPLEATVPSAKLRAEIDFSVRWLAEHRRYGNSPLVRP